MVVGDGGLGKREQGGGEGSMPTGGQRGDMGPGRRTCILQGGTVCAR